MGFRLLDFGLVALRFCHLRGWLIRIWLEVFESDKSTAGPDTKVCLGTNDARVSL